MRSHQVILREDVAHLGETGDVVKVRLGYARNYLFPHRLALPYTPADAKIHERRRAKQAVVKKKLAAEAQQRAVALSAVVLRVAERADEGGHLYGSVSAAAVAKLLGDGGHVLAPDSVRLEQPIKTVGEHKVTVHVHGDFSAQITVLVERQSG
jgi:large subunit ribosomal protein L9